MSVAETLNVVEQGLAIKIVSYAVVPTLTFPKLIFVGPTSCGQGASLTTHIPFTITVMTLSPPLISSVEIFNPDARGVQEMGIDFRAPTPRVTGSCNADGSEKIFPGLLRQRIAEMVTG